MAEYIEREAVRNAVRSKTMTKYDWSEEIDFEDFEKVLDGIPTADVAPVKRGRWKEWAVQWRECSACRYRIQYSYAKDCNFCPNCGARMDGE